MNLAFPAFFIFLVLLPGFLFIFVMKRDREQHHTPPRITTTAQDVAEASLASIALHGVAILVAANAGYPVDFEAVLELVAAPKQFDFGRMDQSSAAIWAYGVGVYAGSAALGKAIGHVANRNGWFPALGWSDQVEEKSTWLSLLTSGAEPPILYKGLFEGVEFHKDGTARYVTITKVQKAEFHHAEEEPTWVEVDAQSLVIDGGSILNIAIDIATDWEIEGTSSESELKGFVKQDDLYVEPA
ncbi:MAG: DUF6338 family protein [Myxococcota bacterium]